MAELDFQAHLAAVGRSVSAGERDGAPVRSVRLDLPCDVPPGEVWSAATDPERLRRWFLPVGGDLVPGGRFQLEGNAGGTITDCVPPRLLSTTWEFGGGMSWLELRIAQDGAHRSRLTLTHICPVDEHWQAYGPGAAGVGWDLGLLGLALHLGGVSMDRAAAEAFPTSPEGRAFIAGAADGWRRADIAAGENPAQAEFAAKRTAAFYTGDPAPEG